MLCDKMKFLNKDTEQDTSLSRDKNRSAIGFTLSYRYQLDENLINFDHCVINVNSISSYVVHIVYQQ